MIFDTWHHSRVVALMEHVFFSIITIIRIVLWLNGELNGFSARDATHCCLQSKSFDRMGNKDGRDGAAVVTACAIKYVCGQKVYKTNLWLNKRNYTRNIWEKFFRQCSPNCAQIVRFGERRKYIYINLTRIPRTRNANGLNHVNAWQKQSGQK